VLSIRTWDLDVKRKRPPLPKPPHEIKSAQTVQKNLNDGQILREAREQLVNQPQVCVYSDFTSFPTSRHRQHTFPYPAFISFLPLFAPSCIPIPSVY
jgi:hypothetical protein